MRLTGITTCSRETRSALMQPSHGDMLNVSGPACGGPARGCRAAVWPGEVGMIMPVIIPFRFNGPVGSCLSAPARRPTSRAISRGCASSRDDAECGQLLGDHGGKLLRSPAA
jgi:hypothetical protein